MCSSCKDLYYSNYGTFECYECGYKDSNLLGIYIMKVVLFLCVNYALARLLLRSWPQPNQETMPTFRIMLTMCQTFAIITKMDALRSKKMQEQEMQQFMDYAVYYTNPD